MSDSQTVANGANDGADDESQRLAKERLKERLQASKEQVRRNNAAHNAAIKRDDQKAEDENLEIARQRAGQGGEKMSPTDKSNRLDGARRAVERPALAANIAPSAKKPDPTGPSGANFVEGLMYLANLFLRLVKSLLSLVFKGLADGGRDAIMGGAKERAAKEEMDNRMEKFRKTLSEVDFGVEAKREQQLLALPNNAPRSDEQVMQNVAALINEAEQKEEMRTILMGAPLQLTASEATLKVNAIFEQASDLLRESLSKMGEQYTRMPEHYLEFYGEKLHEVQKMAAKFVIDAAGTSIDPAAVSAIVQAMPGRAAHDVLPIDVADRIESALNGEGQFLIQNMAAIKEAYRVVNEDIMKNAVHGNRRPVKTRKDSGEIIDDASLLFYKNNDEPDEGGDDDGVARYPVARNGA